MVAVALFCFAAFTGWGCSQSSQPNDQTTHVIVFSDVHFNPFYDQTLFNALVAAPVNQWQAIFESSSIT
jgi:hypothetical protein